jgi:hypothetical protein
LAAAAGRGPYFSWAAWSDAGAWRPLTDVGDLDVVGDCCLYDRIPGGGTCADCVLTPEDVRRQHWRSILDR